MFNKNQKFIQLLIAKVRLKFGVLLLLCLVMVLMISNPALAGPPVDAYADAVDPSTGGLILNPANATGAPDGNRATVIGIVGQNLVLDMGAGEEGTGDLIVHYGGLTVGVVTTVQFLDDSQSVITSGSLNLVEVGVGSFTATVTYDSAPVPYRFVRLVGVLDAYLIDAVEATTYRPDSDGDGVPDTVEDRDNDGNPANDDTDSDSIPDALDDDDDGDNVPTAGEDVDNDGNPANDDTDGDTVPNYLDDDDDGDGVLSKNEDANADNDPANDDADADTVPDYLEPNDVDTDGDGTMNNEDPDDDGDNVPTRNEDANNDNNPINDDSDGDGIPDYLDVDSRTGGIAIKIYLPVIFSTD